MWQDDAYYEVREAFVADIPDGLYEWFSPGDTKIAEL